MHANWRLWLLVAMSLLLTYSSAAPTHSKDEVSDEIDRQGQLVSRQPFTLFGFNLEPRLPLTQESEGDGSKKRPAHSKPAHSTPAHAQSKTSKPAHSKSTHSKVAHTKSTVSKSAHSKSTTSKSAHSKSTVSKSAHSKSTTSKSAHSKSTVSKSAHSKSTTSKSAHSKSTKTSKSKTTKSTHSQSSSSKHSSSKHSSSKHSSSTVTSAQVQSTDDVKCNKNGCQGVKCKAKASKSTGKEAKPTQSKAIREIGTSINITARDFLPVNDNGNLAQFPTNNLNQDLSEFHDRESTFARFDAHNAQTIRVQGLGGCTVIAAVSPRGMLAIHLFEDGSRTVGRGKNRVSVPDIADTLHPNAYQATLARARTFLSAHRADLAGGRLVIMMPTNKGKGKKSGLFRYDTETWRSIKKNDPNAYTKAGRVGAPGMVDAIVAMAQDATGLTAENHEDTSYAVWAQDGMDEPSEEAIDGTLVMQYDPNNAPGTDNAAAAQVYIEGNPFFNPVFRFPTPGAAAQGGNNQAAR